LVQIFPQLLQLFVFTYAPTNEQYRNENITFFVVEGIQQTNLAA